MKKRKNRSVIKYKGNKVLSKKRKERWQTLIAFSLPFLFFSFSFKQGVPIASPVKTIREIVVFEPEKKTPPAHKEIVETKKVLPAYLLSPSQIKIAGKVASSGNKKKNKIALTFDDGPTKLTPKILKILSQEGVPATFFMLGWRARANPEMVKKVSQAGNEIGAHTFNHRELSKLKPSQQKKEIALTIKFLQKYSQQPVLWIRPPFGKYNSSTLKICRKMKRGIALWSVDSLDYQRKGVKQIIKNTVHQTKNGSVILMHETTTQTVAALPKIIRALKKRGFKFVTFSQLMADF